jgi:type III restriction enzyme
MSKNWFFLQGWKPHKIRPDFISTRKSTDGSYGFDKVYVIETKGMHLSGNPKTEYIKELFAECNKAKPKHVSDLGFEMNTKPIRFELVHFQDWQNQLTKLIEE